jgi:small subunit ribosomal protein S6
MRLYEVVFLVHPDQSDQVPSMIDRYKKIVEKGGGTVHVIEDWGRRQLAYLINNLPKAHYVMMNIECGKNTLQELNSSFRFNDAVIRSLILARDEITRSPSPMLKNKENRPDPKIAPKGFGDTPPENFPREISEGLTPPVEASSNEIEPASEVKENE